MVRLLLLILINSLQDPVHLLLEEQLELFNHELVNRAPFDKVGDEALHRVTLVHNDPLDAEIGHVHINVKLGFALFAIRSSSSCSGLLLSVALFTAGVGDGEGLVTIDRGCGGMIGVSLCFLGALHFLLLLMLLHLHLLLMLMLLLHHLLLLSELNLLLHLLL